LDNSFFLQRYTKGLEILQLIDKFVYYAKYKDIGSENELCAVLIGEIDPRVVKPNRQEVAEIQFISMQELKAKIKKQPNDYTPWLKLALRRLSTTKD